MQRTNKTVVERLYPSALSPSKYAQQRQQIVENTMPSAAHQQHLGSTFDARGNEFVDIPLYNSLYDKNLQEYFKHKKVRGLLGRACLVDPNSGRILDMDGSRQTVQIIEQEFCKLNKQKQWIQSEQETERVRW